MKGFLSEDLLVKEVLSPIQLPSGVAGSFADVDLHGFDRALLVATVGVWNDTDSTLVLTLINDAVSPASDAVSSDTFTWTITCGDSDDDEVWLADLDFQTLGLTKQYLSLTAVAQNGTDSVFLAMDVVLYERNGLAPVDQDHTVYKG